ncbi:hypothetical protein AB0I45_02525 [Brevibacterium sp. NPDC049920]|nr:hypothetical protein [uncultured Brevibacterium sp.]
MSTLPAAAAAGAVTPIAPKFNDTNGTVYINEQHGVRFHIDVDGTEVTKDGLPYARPGTFTAEHGIRAGVPITVTAVSAGPPTVLTGTTEWTHTLPAPSTTPDPVIPQGPTFDDWEPSVRIPADRGVRYHIDVDGTAVTKDGLD